MGRVVDILVRDLQGLLDDVGRDGGRLGAAVYDTAMGARLAPPEEGPGPALDWLLSQQQKDGGWCSPRLPVGRDLPTLAAVLALSELRKDARSRDACAAGLGFLRAQAEQWTSIPEELPLSLELTLPALVKEAIRAGLDIAEEPYRLLVEAGERKRQAFARMKVARATPPAYAWEALDLPPSDDLLDAAGSVGTSPAATAAWLSRTRRAGPASPACRAAEAYLVRAARATGTGIPGVLPLVFPVDRFEQAWSLLAVFSSGAAASPGVAAAARRVAQELVPGVRPAGMSHTDLFVEDGDDTSCGVAALRLAGYNMHSGPVRRFEGADHFFTFAGERNPGVSTNAHALYALSLCGEDSPRARAFLRGRQAADGRFPGEKFHASWLYATHRAALALGAPEDAVALEKIALSLLELQHADGGYGAGAGPTGVETAHGLLALRVLRQKGVRAAELAEPIARAHRWLLSHYRPFGPPDAPLWIGKELYAMPRVDRALELSALLSSSLDVGE